MGESDTGNGMPVRLTFHVTAQTERDASAGRAEMFGRLDKRDLAVREWNSVATKTYVLTYFFDDGKEPLSEQDREASPCAGVTGEPASEMPVSLTVVIKAKTIHATKDVLNELGRRMWLKDLVYGVRAPMIWPSADLTYVFVDGGVSASEGENV